VGLNPILGWRSRKTYRLAGAILLLLTLYSGGGREVQARSQSQMQRQQPASSEPFVIQGRITGVQGTLVTVKLPDGYPGGQGSHAQFVTAGPTFRVDVSHARVLLPDGRQADKLPLAVGDRVLMVLTPPDSASAEPGSLGPSYSASVVERVVQGDRVVTH
jgi:hypothetical protein